MHVDNKVLKLLRCPVTSSQLEIADAETIEWINQRFEGINSQDWSEQMVNSKIEQALINADRSLALPIRAGVISLVAERAIRLSELTK